MGKRLLCMVLVFVMCLSSLPMGAFAAVESYAEDSLTAENPVEEIIVEAQKDEIPKDGKIFEEALEEMNDQTAEQEPVPYLAYKNGVFETEYCYEYTSISNDTLPTLNKLTSGWYVLDVDEGHTSTRITIEGDVKFIVTDNTECYFDYGIGLHAGNKLSIYTQSTFANMTSLFVDNTMTDAPYGAGIGGDSADVSCGDLYVYGGWMGVWGSKYSAGIGGGGNGTSSDNGAGDGGNVTVYGGIIQSHGGELAAGIGGGGNGRSTGSRAGNGGKLTLYGGQVQATGGECGAGIGGGSAYNDSGDGGSVMVYNGTILAYGGGAAAGIGGGTLYDDNTFSSQGSGGNGGRFMMLDGTVTAYGGNTSSFSSKDVGGGAGIGGGLYGDGGSITVSGGTLKAYGAEDAAGIGGGGWSEGGTFTLNDGQVTAVGGRFGAGIGGGRTARGGVLEVNGGNLVVEGGTEGAGIGGGKNGAGGRFTLNGGKVTVKGGDYGAGIGGGREAAGGDVYLNGGELDATYGYETFAIGGGDNIDDEGDVYVKDGICVWDLLSKQIYNPDGGSRDWNSIFQRKDHVHVELIPVWESGDLFVSADYLTYDEKTGSFVEATCSQAQPVSNEKMAFTTWTTGWYVVNRDAVIDDRVSVLGNVNLILQDGCTLTVNNGIHLAIGSSLKIYAQSEDADTMGKLFAECRTDGGAGIGGGPNGAGLVTIYGGNVTARGGKWAAGIGGGCDAAGAVTVYGGSVEAYGGEEGTGIGGGSNAEGVVTVYGGSVKATGGESGAGIGSGYNAEGTVTVYGGNVIAYGGTYAAGIGGGLGGAGTVTIEGGSVYGYGACGGAGIGGGAMGIGTVTLCDATVYGTGGNAKALDTGLVFGGGAGIGGGANGSGIVSINGGSVYATGGAGGGPGIGGGCGPLGNCKVLVDGDAYVVTTGGDSAHVSESFKVDTMIDGGPGIGSGLECVSGRVEIRDGLVHAVGGKNIHLDMAADGSAVNAEHTIMNAHSGRAIKVTTDNDETVKYYQIETEVAYPGKPDVHFQAIDISEVVFSEIAVPFVVYKEGKYETAYCEEYTRVSTGALTAGSALKSGWYLLDGGTAGGRITISGDVRFILLNGADCHFKNGIGLHAGNKLTIYAQPEENGKSVGQLRTSGSTSEYFYTNMGVPGGAGIGGDYDPKKDLDVSCGELHIHGGKLDIKGTDSSAGIGGSGYVKPDKTSLYLVGNGGNVYIYGGDVTATGGRCGAGIGGGSAAEKAGNGGNVYVYGGTVHAYGGDACAGIGGGTMINDNVFSSNEGTGGSGGNFVMYGGTVYAYGGNTSPLGTKDVGGGAGIGGGLYGVAGNVTVNGGTLEAVGAEDAAGIGGGGWSAGGTFTLNGGKVIAKGGRFGAAIGGGREAKGSEVYLNGGELDATFGYETFAIGGGDNINDEGNVHVKDGVCVFDLLSELLYNPDGRSRDWNSIFQRKEYVHVKLVPAAEIPSDLLVSANYLAYDEKTKSFAEATCSQAQPISNDVMTFGTWTNGWYIVNENITVDKPITVNGNVNLILQDGCKLTANGGICVETGSSLNIYAQSTAFATVGKLTATSSADGYAGIGSGPNKASGNITFYGGYVIGNGGRQAAGIGGGSEGAGTVTIYGGTVFGNGGESKELTFTDTNVGGGAGIGGGYNASGTVEIYGGKVNAHGGNGGGAGIGGGAGPNGGCNVLIDGAIDVTAYGGANAYVARVFFISKSIDVGPGIGGGAGSKSGTVEMKDGKVYAMAGENKFSGKLSDGEALKAPRIIMNPYADFAIKRTPDGSDKSTYYLTKTEGVKFTGVSAVTLETVVKDDRMVQEVEPSDPEVPATGDESLTGLWTMLMLVSAMGLSFCILRKKRSY